MGRKIGSRIFNAYLREVLLKGKTPEEAIANIARREKMNPVLVQRIVERLSKIKKYPFKTFPASLRRSRKGAKIC